MDTEGCTRLLFILLLQMIYKCLFRFLRAVEMRIQNIPSDAQGLSRIPGRSVPSLARSGSRHHSLQKGSRSPLKGDRLLDSLLEAFKDTPHNTMPAYWFCCRCDAHYIDDEATCKGCGHERCARCHLNDLVHCGELFISQELPDRMSLYIFLETEYGQLEDDKARHTKY